MHMHLERKREGRRERERDYWKKKTSVYCLWLLGQDLMYVAFGSRHDVWLLDQDVMCVTVMFQAELDKLRLLHNSQSAEWQLELKSRLEKLASELDAKWTETMR